MGCACCSGHSSRREKYTGLDYRRARTPGGRHVVSRGPSVEALRGERIDPRRERRVTRCDSVDGGRRELAAHADTRHVPVIVVTRQPGELGSRSVVNSAASSAACRRWFSCFKRAACSRRLTFAAVVLGSTARSNSLNEAYAARLRFGRSEMGARLSLRRNGFRSRFSVLCVGL